MGDPLLRALVDLRDRQIQKARVQFELRLKALERGSDVDAGGVQAAVLQKYLDSFQSLEGELDRDIAELVKEHKFYSQLVSVKGVGPMLAAKLIALIDIEKAPTVSALWRYAGYSVGPDGRRERLVKGETRHYNSRLKSTLYLVGCSFLRSGSPYVRIYQEAKLSYKRRHPDWTKAHVHLAALGNMIKLFLAHLWERWRMLEGLPVRPAYILEQGGHTSVLEPEDFGWPKPSIIDGESHKGAGGSRVPPSGEVIRDKGWNS